MKRAFDLFFSVPGLILLTPIFLVISLMIKMDNPGEVFYKQERVGQFGKMFKIVKFRTMKANADQNGLLITVDNDLRITKIGHFLRKYKIDELPQLINVIKGEMSLVGPRPEVKRYVEMYSEDQKEVLNAKPGITDPASLKYRNESDLLKSDSIHNAEELYIKEIMPDKLRINISYAKNRNIFTDFCIIIRTIFIK